MSRLRCPWCGGVAWAEEVDIGVGSMQVTPAICGECEAQQMGPYDDRSDADAMERLVCWWRGQNTDEAVIIVDGRPRNAERWWASMGRGKRFADDHPEYSVVFAKQYERDAVHECHVQVDYSARRECFYNLFVTTCGLSFEVTPEAPADSPTCIPCVMNAVASISIR